MRWSRRKLIASCRCAHDTDRRDECGCRQSMPVSPNCSGTGKAGGGARRGHQQPDRHGQAQRPRFGSLLAAHSRSYHRASDQLCRGAPALERWWRALTGLVPIHPDHGSAPNRASRFLQSRSVVLRRRGGNCKRSPLREKSAFDGGAAASCIADATATNRRAAYLQLRPTIKFGNTQTVEAVLLPRSAEAR